VIRFKKGAVGTELWAAMSPLHDGVLTNSPIETTAGDPDVYRFAIKARTRSGLESSDASVRYVDIVLPAIGADQIVALLTTPIFSVPSSSAGVVTTFTTLTGTFRVYYNGVLTTAGLTWSVQSDPSSLGVTIDSGTGVYSLAFPGSPSGWWTAATPSATVRLRAALTADPAAYREIDLVIQKSMAGADAQAIKMNTTAGSMSYDTAGTAYPAAQTITLTLTRIPTTLAGTATWVATAYDSTLTSLGTVTLGGSGDTRTLTSAQFTAPGGSFNNAVQYVNVVATVGTLTANQGIVRLTDGQEAIISFLTNPAVTLPASSAGVVTDWSAATGTFQVWQGNTNVTSGITYAIQSNPSTLWATIHATTGVYSVSGQTSWADASAIHQHHLPGHAHGQWRVSGCGVHAGQGRDGRGRGQRVERQQWNQRHERQQWRRRRGVRDRAQRADGGQEQHRRDVSHVGHVFVLQQDGQRRPRGLFGARDHRNVHRLRHRLVDHLHQRGQRDFQGVHGALGHHAHARTPAPGRRHHHAGGTDHRADCSRRHPLAHVAQLQQQRHGGVWISDQRRGGVDGRQGQRGCVSKARLHQRPKRNAC
jgi:hypothetical protein